VSGFRSASPDIVSVIFLDQLSNKTIENFEMEESTQDIKTTANQAVWSETQWQLCQNEYLLNRPAVWLNLLAKRIFDVTIAGIGLVMISPLLLVIAIAVKLTSPGPALFKQKRLGQKGRTFTIYKFRTMVDGAVNLGAGLRTFEGDPRITPLGKFLRDYHLDELPQLLNVLKGDMSLVGPRPLLPSELALYNSREKQRLLVPPGMTAWEAVNGGLDNSREERIELDLWYVDHWNFGVDLLILVRTVSVVLLKEGLYEKPPESQLSD
jgi:sugar transferase EpsL